MFNNGDIYEKNENGKVFCGKNIMLSIINLAAKEISGVSSLCSNFSTDFLYSICFSPSFTDTGNFC